MRNQAQQEYFDRAYKYLMQLIKDGVEYPDALWNTRTAFMFTAKATQDLQDRYDNESI